jgi:hypothetical protein
MMTGPWHMPEHPYERDDSAQERLLEMSEQIEAEKARADAILRVSKEYAEVCADCEELRVTEGYPQARWRAAWDRRMKLQSEWARLAKMLTTRPTDPPESGR